MIGQLVRLFLLFAFICMPFNSAAQSASAKQNQEQEQKLDEKQQLQALGWGDWQQDIMTIDLYALPLTAKHRNILTNKIEQLKANYGVGVLGDIEQAISELDASNLLGDTTTSKKTTQGNQFHDDLQLEAEILVLEFADNNALDDPEGLNVSSENSEKLFNIILAKLAALESHESKAIKNNEKGE